MISHGCVINGTVVNSVLSPGVRVDVGAVVRDSIVMFDTVIRSGAVVDRAILDKEVVVGQGAIVGDGPDFDTPNKQEPGRLNTGITVVGKQSVVPRGTRLGRNVKVGERVKSTDYHARTIRSGGTVDRRPRASRTDAASDADEPPARVTEGAGS
jgi:glucose-1-phosphate adenylyltransferase